MNDLVELRTDGGIDIADACDVEDDGVDRVVRHDMEDLLSCFRYLARVNRTEQGYHDDAIPYFDDGGGQGEDALLLPANRIDFRFELFIDLFEGRSLFFGDLSLSLLFLCVIAGHDLVGGGQKASKEGDISRGEVGPSRMERDEEAPDLTNRDGTMQGGAQPFGRRSQRCPLFGFLDVEDGDGLASSHARKEGGLGERQTAQGIQGTVADLPPGITFFEQGDLITPKQLECRRDESIVDIVEGSRCGKSREGMDLCFCFRTKLLFLLQSALQTKEPFPQFLVFKDAVCV